MENQEKWHCLTSGNELKFEKDALKFIFSEAQTLVKQTFDTSNIIASRSTTILGVLITIFTFSFGITINQLSSIKPNIPLFFTGLLLVIYISILIIYLLKNIKRHDYYSAGEQPKELFNDFFTYEKEGENTTNALYDYSIKKYQKKFDENNAINNRRWKRYNRVLIGVVSIPLLLLLLYFSFYFIILNLECPSLLRFFHHQ